MIIPNGRLDNLTEVQTPIRKSNELQKRFRRIPGVRWWQLDTSTGEVDEVKFDSVTAAFEGDVQNRIDVKEGILYVPAINKRNAERKFMDMVQELALQGTVLQEVPGL